MSFKENSIWISLIGNSSDNLSKIFPQIPAFVDFDKVVKGIDEVKHVNYNVIKMGGIEKKSCKKGIVINVMWQF